MQEDIKYEGKHTYEGQCKYILQVCANNCDCNPMFCPNLQLTYDTNYIYIIWHRYTHQFVIKYNHFNQNIIVESVQYSL